MLLLSLPCHAVQKALEMMLSATVPKFLEMVRTDDDRQVAMTVLDALNDMLKAIKEPVLKCTGSPDVLIAVVCDVLQRKVFGHEPCGRFRL